MIERAFQVAERNVGIDCQSFDLVKDWRVRRVERVVPVNLSGTHHAHRRLRLLHGVDLYWRGMGAEQQPIALRLRILARNEERVLRVTRWMVRRKVQRLEVVIIGFNLRTLFDRVAQIAEDTDNFLHRLDYKVFRANGSANARKGDVETLGHELHRGRSALNTDERCLHRLFDLGFEFVDALADLALVRAGRPFQPQFIELSEDAVFAPHPAITKCFPIALGSDRR